MARLNVPWWVGVVVASFLSYFALLVYCDIRRPEHAGISTQFQNDRMHLSAVTPGSPADRAGLRPDDQILTWDGWPIRGRIDLMAADVNVIFGVVREVEVLRGGERLQVALPPVTRATRRYWQTQPGIALMVVRAGQLVALAFAVFVLFKRPRDPLARTGVWLLASWAVFSLALPYRVAAVWRELPWPVGLLFWFPHISSQALPALLFTFFVAMFPKSLLHSARALTLVWIPMLVSLAWAGMVHFRMVYPSNPLTSLPDWSQVPLVINAVYVVAGLVVLVVNYRRLEGTNERRRVRVLALGALLGFGAGLPVYIRYWIATGSPQGNSFLMSPTAALGTLLSLAFPLCFAYGVLRHRLFDVRVIIRQGIQYALARRLLVSAFPALLGVLLLDLLLHADDGIVPTFTSRGWVYAALGGLAWLARARRNDWLDRLDRHFFRERYNANQILRQVARRVREGGDIAEVASPVVTRIEAALHPEFVALLVRSPSQASYRLLAVSPAGRPLPPFGADTKVIALLRLLDKPLQVSLTDSNWVMRQLPETESSFLREAHIELLVPIATDPQRMEALLVLGPKRSEEPYGPEDLDLLDTIADNLALLLAQAKPAVETGTGTFEECPRCGVCYDTGTGRCRAHDVPLTASGIPRLLSDRYRLTCRLGEGGMAKVYEALDTSLQRTVAAKVIREDLFRSQEAVQRFEREARIVAAFTHPNVVTIHDFGSSNGARGNRVFLIMERLRGATLRSSIRHGPMPPERVVEILSGVCAGLGAAHRQQLVHRDLKPENIFLVEPDHGGVTKILDFGIAKALPRDTAGHRTADTRAGVVLGTLSYMAPEQLRGEDVQLAWDLWALAVVTYEMLTGQHPFADRAPGAGFVGHATAIDAGLSGASESWRPFFARTLDLDPERRPESPAMFLAELREALSL